MRPKSVGGYTIVEPIGHRRARRFRAKAADGSDVVVELVRVRGDIDSAFRLARGDIARAVEAGAIDLDSERVEVVARGSRRSQLAFVAVGAPLASATWVTAFDRAARDAVIERARAQLSAAHNAGCVHGAVELDGIVVGTEGPRLAFWGKRRLLDDGSAAVPSVEADLEALDSLGSRVSTASSAMGPPGANPSWGGSSLRFTQSTSWSDARRRVARLFVASGGVVALIATVAIAQPEPLARHGSGRDRELESPSSMTSGFIIGGVGSAISASSSTQPPIGTIDSPLETSTTSSTTVGIESNTATLPGAGPGTHNTQGGPRPGTTPPSRPSSSTTRPRTTTTTTQPPSTTTTIFRPSMVWSGSVFSDTNLWYAGRGGGCSIPQYRHGKAPSMNIAVQAGQVFTLSATGSVKIAGNIALNGPAGGHGTAAHPSTQLLAENGISGMNVSATGFLAGAFVGAGGAGPTYAGGWQFAALHPAVNQAFYVGTGRYQGADRQFVVPSGATRFVLGIPDGNNTMGCPGYYADNTGWFDVSVTRIH